MQVIARFGPPLLVSISYEALQGPDPAHRLRIQYQEKVLVVENRKNTTLDTAWTWVSNTPTAKPREALVIRSRSFFFLEFDRMTISLVLNKKAFR